MLVYGAPVSVAVPVAVFAPREDERPRKTSTEAGALVQLDRIEILRSNRQRHDRRALQNAPRQLDETARGDALPPISGEREHVRDLRAER